MGDDWTVMGKLLSHWIGYVPQSHPQPHVTPFLLFLVIFLFLNLIDWFLLLNIQAVGLSMIL